MTNTSHHTLALGNKFSNLLKGGVLVLALVGSLLLAHQTRSATQANGDDIKRGSLELRLANGDDIKRG